MKIIFWIKVAALTGFYACTGQIEEDTIEYTKDKDSVEAKIVVAGTPHHLQLNGSEKWVVDKAIESGISQIKKAVRDFKG